MQQMDKQREKLTCRYNIYNLVEFFGKQENDTKDGYKLKASISILLTDSRKLLCIRALDKFLGRK